MPALPETPMKPIVTTSRKHRQQLGAPKFPWPLVGCAFVLVAGLVLIRSLRKDGIPTPVEPVIRQVSASHTTTSPIRDDIDDAQDTANQNLVNGDAEPYERPRGKGTTDAGTDSAKKRPAPPPIPTRPVDPDNPDLAAGFGQMLSMLYSVELGDDPPPFPMPYSADETGNEDFEVTATNQIVIGENDTAQDERRKEDIAWAKLDIAEYVKNGGKAKDALNEIYKYYKDCAKMRTEAADYFREWLTENPEEEEEVLKEFEEYNAKLKADGIKVLDIEEIQPFED